MDSNFTMPPTAIAGQYATLSYKQLLFGFPVSGGI